MLVLTYVVGEPSKLDSASDYKSSIFKSQVIAEVPVTHTVPDTGSNTFAPCARSCERYMARSESRTPVKIPGF